MQSFGPSGTRNAWSLAPKDYGDFEEGSTRLYRLRSLEVDEEVVKEVERMVMERRGTRAGAGAEVELLVGMITLQDLAHAPLDVTAVAILEGVSNEVYLAVRIRGTSYGSGTLTEKGVYGGKRIVIVARPGGSPLIECVFNIVRQMA